jgi:hypothetical protein
MRLSRERFVLETIHAMQACMKFAIASEHAPARETRELRKLITQRAEL